MIAVFAVCMKIHTTEYVPLSVAAHPPRLRHAGNTTPIAVFGIAVDAAAPTANAVALAKRSAQDTTAKTPVNKAVAHPVMGNATKNIPTAVIGIAAAVSRKIVVVNVSHLPPGITVSLMATVKHTAYSTPRRTPHRVAFPGTVERRCATTSMITCPLGANAQMSRTALM